MKVTWLVGSKTPHAVIESLRKSGPELRQRIGAECMLLMDIVTGDFSLAPVQISPDETEAPFIDAEITGATYDEKRLWKEAIRRLLATARQCVETHWQEHSHAIRIVAKIFTLPNSKGEQQPFEDSEWVN